MTFSFFFGAVEVFHCVKYLDFGLDYKLLLTWMKSKLKNSRRIIYKEKTSNINLAKAILYCNGSNCVLTEFSYCTQ